MGLITRLLKAGLKISKKSLLTGSSVIGRFSANIDNPLLKKILNLGIDLSTRSGVKTALALANEDTSLADELYIELRNALNREGFKKVPFNKRALFLPQCLRSAEHCKAELSDEGYVCKECGSCTAYTLKKEAEKLGYKVFIIPGGSMVMNILKNNSVEAVLGVACKLELCQGAERLASTSIWAQGVPLLRDGCKNTSVDVEKVLTVIRMR
ncbi:MAG: DUF116 domain-containing protein [Candidatus Thermoplasmatota archaeon]|nr:DUF116 domain-containing protein [Candidatus Thermoplasmatota archaeon]